MDSNLEQLENEFYTLLTRIFVIQCARRAQQQQDGNRLGPRKILTTSRRPWHIFLDCLCTLCDSESGGATTTAIGVEQIGFRSIFWIATNQQLSAKRPSATSKPHLQDVQKFVTSILKRLAEVNTASSSNIATRREIFQDSIEFCKNRVAHYRRYALKYIASIETATCGSTNRYYLIQQIAQLLNESQDDCATCKNAYDFCRSEAGRRLRGEILLRSTAWVYLRHNIGRLAHWYKAAKFLVNAAPGFANALTNYIVDMVPQVHRPTRRVPFRGSLIDLFPSTELMNYDFSLDRMRIVFGDVAMCDAKNDLDALLDSPSRLKLHAEVHVADFFYSSKRLYSGDDQYIGCSKGSCYCCDLYFSVHPANLVRRPCHGNAWVKWQFPAAMLMRIAGSTPLERMILRMSDDINRAVMDKGQYGHAKTFDSSTGMMSFQ